MNRRLWPINRAVYPDDGRTLSKYLLRDGYTCSAVFSTARTLHVTEPGIAPSTRIRSINLFEGQDCVCWVGRTYFFYALLQCQILKVLRRLLVYRDDGEDMEALL